jgi:hypothetical protein
MSFIAAGVTAAVGATVGIGGAIAGGVAKADAAKDAARTQAAAGDKALAHQKSQYETQRADQQPWRDAGTGALSKMQDADFSRDFTADDFTKDPGYDFRMAEGQKALERSAAARGGLQSGGTLKALSRYGQDYASSEYGKVYDRFNADRDRRFGRLSTIAGMGQHATDMASNAAANYGNSGASIMTGVGDQQAASRIAEGNAYAGIASGVSNSINSGIKNFTSMAGGKMGGGGKEQFE